MWELNAFQLESRLFKTGFGMVLLNTNSYIQYLTDFLVNFIASTLNILISGFEVTSKHQQILVLVVGKFMLDNLLINMGFNALSL